MISSRHTLAHAGTPTIRQTGRRIFERTDIFGLAGLAMMLLGGWFIYTGQYVPPLWVTWIVGPTLWYLGVATTIVWLCWRLFRSRP
jgi:hypothetical protein